ncbi:MAG: 50S ribosomal protein L4 [Acidobacteria bacterium]|nr:MAG: 50S ribosomal protein L4 [Acidobacteriota bacterium]REK07136.1 MAG: 50S ribosomal protein L4 [Acidobacteriota bacterium]
MKLAVKNLSNQSVGECDVPDAVFAYPYKEHLIHQVVVAVRAAARAGTHKTKGRGEVRGGGKKPWRQKGTGRARAGSIRSPLWRSGGTVHGPQPRSYELGVSPREKRNALRSALSRKLSDEQITVLDSFELDSPKTKQLAESLRGLGIEGKALLVDDWNNENLGLASRNNPTLKAVDALGVNVYDVVDREHLVFSKAALDRLVEVLSK